MLTLKFSFQSARLKKLFFSSLATFVLFPQISFGVPVANFLGSDNDTQFLKITQTNRLVSDAYDAFIVPYMNNPIIPGISVKDPYVIKQGGVMGNWSIYTVESSEIYLRKTSKNHLDFAVNTENSLSSSSKVVSKGIYAELAEPSLTIVGDPFFEVWHMALSVKRTDGTTWIASIISSDGVNWTLLNTSANEISISGATFSNISSPSLIYNKSQFRYELYFQGIKSGDTVEKLHLAYSSDATAFTFQQAIGDMLDADVKMVKGNYISAFRYGADTNPKPIRYASSSDGKAFSYKGIILEQDPINAYDNNGTMQPSFAIEGERIVAILYTGYSGSINQVGIAYPQVGVRLLSGSVVHVNRQAMDLSNQRVSIANYTVDTIQVQNFPGGPFTINSSISAKAGDLYSVFSTYYVDQWRNSVWASSELSGYPASLGIDGDITTMYSSQGFVSSTNTVTYNLNLGPTPLIFQRIRIRPRGDSKSFPVSFNFEVSDDALAWTPIVNQSYTNYPTPPVGGNEVVFTLSNYVRAKYVRIVATQLGFDVIDYKMQFTEFNVDTFNGLDWGQNLTSSWTVHTNDILYNFQNLYNSRIIKNTSDTNFPYKMWIFGSASVDGNDKIYAGRATSIDGPWQVYQGNQQWDTTMTPSLWVPVMTAGSTNYDNIHNGDPSVVLQNGTYYMAFSSVGIEYKQDPDGVFRNYIRNCVMGATSTDGISWTKSAAPILIWNREYIEGWDATKGAAPSYGGYHRPSLIYDSAAGKWKLWFDYFHPGYFLTTGYAENAGDFMSSSAWNILRNDDNPVMTNWVNPNVVMSGGTYYAFADPQGFGGTLGPHRRIAMQTSTDGLNWSFQGFLSPELGKQGAHVPEAYVENINGTNYLYVFYSREPETNPYDPRYKSIRYLVKVIP